MLLVRVLRCHGGIHRIVGVVGGLQISLKPRQLDNAMPFHLRFLNTCRAATDSDAAHDALKSLSFVLYENADRCTKVRSGAGIARTQWCDQCPFAGSSTTIC